MSAEGTTRKRMGITAIVSSIFIVASIVWGLYGFALIQFGAVRPYDPHYEYSQIDYWPYTHNFTGSNGNWFDGINYTDLPIDQQLPNDTLDNLDQPVFYVIPQDPGQLWRIESYDQYDGSSWTKSVVNTYPLDGTQLIPLTAVTNPLYVVLFNASAGAEVGAISLPSIFPALRVIEDSFVTYSLDNDTYVPDDPTRLLHYDLETDDYGTLIFRPLIEGITGEDVRMSFMLTYVDQDIVTVQNDALPGGFAPAYTDMYRDLSLVQPLSQRVIDGYSQFIGIGTNAYETAMAVQVYFQSTFELNISQEALFDRPEGEEVTDWFLERGNGLAVDFATSYAVFMRSLGIPARMVSGFALGDRHPTVDMRTLMVRHMTFWVEVFIPMSGHIFGGEWIQVVPTPLPENMGGDEDPTNTPIPDIELIIFPTSGLYWAEIGVPYGMSATISVDGVYIETPDTIVFFDTTDVAPMGSADIGASLPPPIANITYTFPTGTTIGDHIISATWQNSYFIVSNTTRVVVVGTPTPLADESISEEPTDIILPETYDVDINQDIDTYVAYWEDYLHVFGVMTVNGDPVNGSKYGNRYIQIRWDDFYVGDAFIDDYGYYELDVYLDPLNLTAMTVGPHDVWSSYEGDWDDDIEYWRLRPANSTYTSTVTLWGRIGFDLYVTPDTLFAGGTLSYTGNIYFLNGTLLPSGQTVTTYFHTQDNSSRPVNVTGGFDWIYLIPGAQSDGTYEAYADWVSPFPFIAGNRSLPIYIDVGAGGAQILINMLPDPVFILETYTIWGYLQHVSNNSGIGSQWVDVYWSAGSVTYIGSSFTAADGYFEVSYVIPAGYEGLVTYWANFTSPLPQLTNAESLHIETNVKRYDVDITIADSPDPIHLLQTVTIQGMVTLPENASSPLSNVLLEIYWANSTYPGGVLIGTTWTNDTGGYAFYHQIPLSHGIETVNYVVSFTSPFINIADRVSPIGSIDIIATGTLLTVFSDSTSYYLNETVLISGNLQFSNGTPFVDQLISIQWINATGTWIFEKYTDINGDYFFQYNLSASMDTGLVNVHVDYTATSGLYDDASDDLSPPIQLNKYDLVLVLTTPSEIYVDEDLIVQGVLTTSGGSPMVGADIYIAYNNGTHWIVIDLITTNSTGGFTSNPIPFVTQEEDTYSFAAIYYSPDPVVNDIGEIFFLDRVKYAINLEITILPNPVMQNETLQIHAYLFYAHNGTPIANADVGVWWYNGSLRFLENITTDATGQGDLFYAGMHYDDIRDNIEVYGYYGGTILRRENESIHILLTLEQWESELIGLGTPVPDYNLLDTVVVTGTLQYVSPSIPYGGAFVELLVSGVPVDGTTTATDGTFTLFWTIPSNTSVGDYDLLVRYLTPAPWIVGVQDYVPTITITAPGYDFPSFIVSPEAPSVVIILDYLTIAGIVNYDNGTPYADSWVSIYWGDPLGANEWLLDVLTDGAGTFITYYQVPGGTPLGLREVWAYIPPIGIATSGMSPPRTINIQQHAIVITSSVDMTTAHLGETIIISGTAHFLNTTPLTGYAIEIWWGPDLISTEYVDEFGDFSYSHLIPFTDPVGVKSGYVFFGAPTAAFHDETDNFADVEVREYVNLYMNTLPGPLSVSRGDTITILGYVGNDGWFDAVGVLIHILVNNASTSVTGSTDAFGYFSIDLDIPDDVAAGQYNITIESIDPYRDVLSITGLWTVNVIIASTIEVQVSSAAFMPGESVSLTLLLHDIDGNPIDGASIEIRLNTTVIGTVTLNDGSGSTVTVTIPRSWSNNGYSAFTVEYTGSTYLLGDSSISINSIHVFTDVVFINNSPGRVAPGRSFTISVQATDPADNPIISRTATIDVEGITSIDLTTDSEGIISLDLAGQSEGTVEFTITLTSDVSDVVSGTYEIMIQTQGGIILQGTDLIIAGVLLVGAVIAVLAYLYIVKGMFRSVVISRGIDIPTKLRNIKKLADAGKYGASITLAYRTFEQMCGTKMGSERTHSETAREYLDRVIQSISLDGPTVEQFVQTYEEARFSHHEMTRERYEAALRVFTDLYPRIDTSTLME